MIALMGIKRLGLLRANGIPIRYLYYLILHRVLVRLSKIRKGRACDRIAALLLPTLSKIRNSVLREAGDSHASSKLIYVNVYRLVLIRLSCLTLNTK